MLSLATFIKQAKRKTRYGAISNTSDQTTKDIVHYINERRFRIWRRYPWYWTLKEAALSISANKINYNLSTELGSIFAIDSGEGYYLKGVTLKQYLQWYRGSSSSGSTGNVTRYVKVGYDATTKAIKIKIWKTPTASASMTVYGKKRIERYSISDIATNTGFEFFPEEVMGVLMTGVVADIYKAMGQNNDAAQENLEFKQALEEMVGEEHIQDDQDQQSPPPDYYAWAKRKRGGTTVV